MIQDAASRLAALDAFYDVTMALKRDVDRCQVALEPLLKNHPQPTPPQREEGQFWFRTLARTFFSLIEGVSHTLRQSALDFYVNGQLALTPGEYVLLAQKRYSWDGGKITARDAHNSFYDNLQIAFTLFPKASGVDFRLDTKDHRYQSFREALKLRNTLTHPKTPRDLELSSEIIKHLGDAVGWFASEALRMQKLCYDTIDPAVGEEWMRIKALNPAPPADG